MSTRARRAGLREVAQLANVSISVASRALTGDPALRARAATIERVHAAAHALGYRPNAAGRALRTRAVGVLGVILPDVNNPFFSELLSGIEDACDSAGVVPLIGRAERLAENPHLLRDLVTEGRVDGFLVQPTDTFADATFRDLAAESVPHVFLVSRPAESASSVVLDDDRGIELATKHLCELGHRRIGFVGGLPEHPTAAPRYAAFRQAVAAFGATSRDEWHTQLGYTFDDGRAALAQMRQASEHPTAIVVATHNSALGVLFEARSREIDVPGDLSVIGLHDSAAAERWWPSLTGVRMPLRELGQRAVVQLLDRLRGDEPRHDRIISPAPLLVVRSSTRARSLS